MSAQQDYPILGAPSISLGTFTQVLQAAHSPAAREAAGIYAAFVAQGVDPAIGLAIAQHESGFGKAGIAVGRFNLFGDRYYGQAGATNAGGWAKFANYTAGAKYEAALLAGPLYGKSGKYATARTFPFRYAPSSDGNSPANYGNAVARLITGWSGGRGSIAYHPSAATIAHHHATTTKHPPHGRTAPTGLAASAKAHPKAAAATGGLAAAAILLIL